jgi:DNA-binding response OmpR family regulator
MARILIVDDDPDLVEACSMVLESAGYQVATATDVASGRAALAAGAFDLLVLDVMMDRPDDGFVFARELKSGGSRVPVLMLTSVGKVTGLDFGRSDDLVPVDAFVEKPVEPAVLLDTVSRLLAAGR